MRYRKRTYLREDTLQMSGTVSHSSRRAHLLTTDKVGGVPCGTCALRGLRSGVARLLRR